MRKFLVAAALLFIAACQSQVSISSLPCTSDLECPSGSSCQSGTCAALPASHEVTIDAPAPVTVGQTLRLTVHAVGGVTWAVEETGGGTIDADGTYHAPAQPGTYHAIATSIADSTKSATVAITVVAGPAAPVISAPAFATRNKPGLTAQVSAPPAGLTFNWTISGGTITSATSGASVTFTAGSAASLQLSCTATNAAGAASAAGSATVGLVDAPDATITGPRFVTARASGYIASVGAQANSTFVWTITGGTITDGAGTSSVTFSAGAGPTVGLSVQVTNEAGDALSGSLSATVVDPVAEPVLAGDGLIGGGARVGQQGGAHVVAPVTNLTYTWTISGGTFTGGGVGSTATGASVTYAGSAAGSLLLTCTATSQAGDSASGTLTVKLVGAAVPTSLLSSSGSPALANGTNIISLTVALIDVNGNAVFGDPIVVTASPPGGVAFTGPGATVNPDGSLSATTGSDGSYAFSMTSTSAGSINVLVNVDGTQLSTAVDFLSGEPFAGTSLLSSDRQSTVADNVHSITFTASIRDQHNNPVQGAQVQFQDGGVNAGSAQTTDASGLAKFVLKSTLAGPRTITALVGQPSSFTLHRSGGVTVGFVAGDPDPGHTTVTPADGAAQVADNSAVISYVLTAADAFGNLATGAAITVAASGSNNTLSSSGGNTDSSGTFTFSLASKTAEQKTVTIGVAQPLAQGSFSITRSALFGAGPPVAAKSSISADAASIIASTGGSAANVKATARDQFGNVVSGAAVQFASTGSNNALSSNGAATTGSDGTATSAFSSTTAEPKTLSAQIGVGAGAFTVTLTTPITVGPAAADSAHSTLGVDTDPNPGLVADNTSPVNYTATVRDPFGNLKPLLPVLASASGSGNTVAPASGSTDANGLFKFTLKTTKAETKTITVTDSPASVLSISASTTFVAGAPVAASSSITTDVNALTASNGSSQATISVALADPFGNPVSNASVQFAASGSGYTFTNAGAATSDATGAASSKLSATKAESKSVTANIGGLFTLTLGSPITISPAAADSAKSAFSSDGNNVVADNATVINYSATIRDTFFNVKPNFAVAVSATGSNNTLSATSGSTDPSGVFTFSLKTKTAELKTVALTDNPSSVLSLQLGSTFVAGAPVFGNSSLTTDVSTVGADGVAKATLTATVKDQFSNLITGASVAFASPGTNITFAAASGNTANGVYSTTVTSDTVQNTTFSAAVNPGSVGLGPVSISFVPGDADKNHTTLTSTPDPITADGNTSTSIALVVEDALGHPVTFLSNVGLTVSGSGNSFVFTNPGTTDAFGRITATLSSTVAETKTITATIPQPLAHTTLTKTLDVHFQAGPPVAGKSSITGPTAGTTIANGTATAALSVSLSDAQGNPVPSVTVTFASSGSNNTFVYAGGSNSSTAAGLVSATLSSVTAETKNITAAIGPVGSPLFTLTLARGLPFVPGDPDSSKTKLTVAPVGTLVADGASAFTFTLLVADKQGNILPGLGNVQILSDGTNNSFTSVTAGGVVSATGVTGTTDSAGKLVVTLSSITAQTANISAKIPQPIAGTTLTLSGASGGLAVQFVAGPAVANKSTITGPVSGSTVADGAATAALSVSINDAKGNPVSGLAVTFASSGSNNTFVYAGGATTTNATGVVSATLSSVTAETKNITAAIGPVGSPLFTLTLARGLPFVPGDPDSSKTKLTVAPVGTLVADGASAFTFTLLVADKQGNILPGLGNVQILSDGTNNSFTSVTAGGVVSATGVTGTTDTNGNLIVTLASTKAQTANISAKIPLPIAGGTLTLSGASGGLAVQFVAGPPVANKSTITGPVSGSTVADGAATAALSVSINDAKGNPVSGLAVTFASSGSNNTFVYAGGATTTNATGVVSATLSSVTAETKNITAAIGPVGSPLFTLTLARGLPFVPGDPDSSKTKLTVAPVGTLVADGASAFTFTLLVADKKGNILPGLANAQILSDGVSNSFASVTAGGVVSATGVTGTTDTNGNLIVTLASTKAQTANISAKIPLPIAGGTLTLSGASGGLAVQFIAGPPTSANTTLTAAPLSLTADGASTTKLSLTLLDANNNSAQSYLLSGIGSSDSGSGRDLISGYTLSAGVYTGTVASTLANPSKVLSWTVTPTQGGTPFTKTVNVNFSPGPASVSTSTITPAAVPLQSYSTDSGNSVTITATFLDVNGNPLSGTATVVVSGTGNTVPASVLLVSGVASFSLSSTKAETKSVTVTLGSFPLSTSVKFLPGAVSTVKSTFTATPASGILADGTQAYSLLLTGKDAQSNLITGLAVTLAGTGAHNVFSPSSGTLAPNGTFSATLASYTPQTENVSATVGGKVLTISNLVFGAPPWQQSTGINGGHVTGIVFDPNAPQTVYASTHLGVMKSTNNGVSWTLVNTGMELQHTLAIGATNLSGVGTVLLAIATASYSATASNSAYRSVDGGNSWTPVTLPGAASSFITSGPSGTFVTAGGASADGGVTWFFSSLNGANITLNSVAPVGVNNGFVGLNAASGGPDVLTSANGVIWTAPSSSTVCGSNGPNSITVDGSSNSSVFYDCKNGTTLYQSINGAAGPFAAVSTALPTSNALIFGDPSQSGRLIAIDSYGEAFESTTSGATWSSRIFYNFYVNNTSVAFEAGNHNNVWVGSSESFLWGDATPGITVITPSGGTYSTVNKNTGMNDAGITQIVFLPNGTAYTWANGLYSTTTGSSWSLVSPGPTTTSPGNVAFTVGAGAYYASFSGGLSYVGTGSSTITWSQINPPVGQSPLLAASPTTPNLVYALPASGGSAHFYYSTSQGGTWISVPGGGGAFPSTAYVMQASPLSNTSFWVTGQQSGGQYGVFYATNHGSSVSFVQTASLAYSLVLDPNTEGTAYAAGAFGIIKITGGSAFTTITAPPTGASSVKNVALDASGVLYCLTTDGFYNPTVYQTFNNGSNWALSTDGLLFGPESNYSFAGSQAFAASPVQGGLVLMGTDRAGVIYTTSGGQ